MNNKIYVVGMGPGGAEAITPQAMAAMEASDIICGYKVYTELLTGLFKGKEVRASAMKKEVARCEEALSLALQGKTVSLVSSGDANIYGMGSLMLEVAEEALACGEVEVEIVAGITAALSGGAVLGAPFSGDFAVISLSDLLTPWEVIEKRLHAAAAGDFPIAIYNPSSAKRAENLSKACAILLGYYAGQTPCGIVRNIGRQGQSSRVLSLAELASTPVDMFSTVFIGNSLTKVVAGRLLTPRGYPVKAAAAAERQ